MNREFNPTSRLVHAVFAAGSLIITLLIVSSITTLANHYSAESMAVAQQVQVAQR